FNPVSGLNDVSVVESRRRNARFVSDCSSAVCSSGLGVTVDHGTVTLGANNALTFTPNADYNGPSVFSYTVANGGANETANITVNVAPVADIVADVVNTNEDTAVTFNPVSGLNEISRAHDFTAIATLIQIPSTAIT